MPSVITEVTVESATDGDVIVTWDVEGQPVAVSISTGHSPDGTDHAPVATASAGETSVRLSGLGPGRHYVSLSCEPGGAVLVASDRRVAFEGVTNFRDLGGYPTSSGGRTRWGRVFRADALHGLSQSDVESYASLGLRVVFDLRGDQERAERPNPVRSRSVPLESRGREDPAGTPQMAVTADTVEEGERFLAQLYLGHLEHGAARIGEIFTALASPDSVPAVFHCHGGKDRTGIVAALLLELLGVNRSIVLDDYQLTARYRRRTQQEGSFRRLLDSGMAPDAAAAVLTTPRWAMDDALTMLDTVHGGIDAFLLGPGGMTQSDLAGVRRLLVSQT